MTSPPPSTNPPPLIGVAGGLGPHAHIEFERLLLAVATEHLDRSAADQDYPPWVLSSMPSTPDRTLALLGRAPSPVPALLQSLRRLAGAGASFAVIPCNTAHAFIDELRAESPIPILDMIDATLRRAAELVPRPARIGLLATTGTCRARVYHQRTEAIDGLEVVALPELPDGEQMQEELVMTPIYGPLRDGERMGGGIKAGVRSPQIEGALRQAVTHLANAGASLVLCGCTEIPLALGRTSSGGTPLLDPMEVAARWALAIARGEAPVPD